MEKKDFKHPKRISDTRKLILKGEVYISSGTIVMATSTTCSLTKGVFSGVCVWVDTNGDDTIRNTLGDVKDNWLISSFD